MKKKNWFEKYLLSLVFGFMGTIFGVIGIVFLVAYFYSVQVTKAGERVPLYTAVQLTDLPTGTVVGVEGQIGEENASSADGLVVYTTERYEGIHCEENNKGEEECEEVWRQIEHVTPPLWLDLSDGSVKVENSEYALINAPETIQTTPNLIENTTLKYWGFRLGSPAYASGTVNTEEGAVLTIDFLYGGSRKEYLASRAAVDMVFAILGGVFAGFGGIFLTVAIVSAVSISRGSR
jgi:hypothetical protein